MKAHALYGVIPLVQPRSDQQFHSDLSLRRIRSGSLATVDSFRGSGPLEPPVLEYSIRGGRCRTGLLTGRDTKTG